jgi:hypothetical protein
MTVPLKKPSPEKWPGLLDKPPGQGIIGVENLEAISHAEGEPSGRPGLLQEYARYLSVGAAEWISRVEQERSEGVGDVRVVSTAWRDVCFQEPSWEVHVCTAEWEFGDKSGQGW